MSSTPGPPSPGPDLVIEGCTALIHGEDGQVGFLPDAVIGIRGGEIVTVQGADVARRPPPARERIDGHGLVAMPGLINCHTHSPMVMFRGAAEDVRIEQWFNDYIWPMEVNLTAADVRLGARLAAAELIRAGVTTFADAYFWMEEVAAVVAETGLRASLGEGFFSSQGIQGQEKSVAFALQWRGKAGGRITTALAPHAPYTVSEKDLELTAALATEHGLPVHIHAAENREQTRSSRASLGVTPIEVLRRTGILDGRVIIAHGTGIVPEDLPALAARARSVGVATAPKGFLKNGLETTPIRALSSAGVPVGLATDGAASNNTLDVWESLLFTALVQKAVEGDPRWMTARQALGHATTQSARCLGLGDKIGRIAPGYRADIILVDIAGPHIQPIHDLAAALVYSARSSDVTTVIVDGAILMRDRELLTADVPDILASLTSRLAALTNRGHGKRIQGYSP